MNALTSLLELPLLSHLGAALLHSLWQGVVVLTCAVLLLRLLRRASAHCRYLVAVATLALVAATPAITLLVSLQYDETSPLTPRAAGSDVEHETGFAHRSPAPADSAATAACNSEGPERAAKQQPDDKLARGSSAMFHSPALWTSHRRTMGELLDGLPPSAALAWLAGVAVMALRMLRGWTGVRRLTRRGARAVAPRLARAAVRIAGELGIRRGVTVLESSLVCVPVVVGWLRPVLLLPASAVLKLTSQELEAMLMHELAHVRRHDYLVNLLQSVVETLLFFHPAVWWLSRRIRAERENCCDDTAVALLGDRRAYARALYRTAALGAAQAHLATAATGGDLSNRFRRLLGVAPVEKRPYGSWAGALACIVATALFFSLQWTPLGAQTESAERRAPTRPERPAVAEQQSPVAADKSPAADQSPTADVSPSPHKDLLLAQVQTVPPPEQKAPSDDEPTARDIWDAAQTRDRESLVKMIGMQPKRLNRLHENGFAALHWAANNGRPDAIELLLELGADVNVKQGKFGGTPLQYAAAKGDVDSMRALIERMATVDAADRLLRTPLMWAAQRGHEKAVELLLESGANVNAAMTGGWTPLHYAVKAGDARSAQRLIDAGADLAKKNNLGKTPLEVGPPLELKLPSDTDSDETPSNSGDGSGSDSGSGQAATSTPDTPARETPPAPGPSGASVSASLASTNAGSAAVERFDTAAVAKAAAAGRVEARVESTEYAKADGRVERAIVAIQRTSGGQRVALLYAEDRHFEIDLPPGRYRLQFTANGSRGATFQPTFREVVIAKAGDTADLGTIDLPLTTTSRLFGRQAPELDGIVGWKHTDPLRLRDLRGKVVVLDFWGYYCTICHQHKPDLAALYDEFRDDGLQVLAVHDGSLETMSQLDEHLSEIARRHWRGKDLQLPIALDRRGGDSVFAAYGVTAVPAVILIDQQGRVVRRFHHAGDPELKATIERLLP